MGKGSNNHVMSAWIIVIKAEKVNQGKEKYKGQKEAEEKNYSCCPVCFLKLMPASLFISGVLGLAILKCLIKAIVKGERSANICFY